MIYSIQLVTKSEIFEGFPDIQPEEETILGNAWRVDKTYADKRSNGCSHRSSRGKFSELLGNPWGETNQVKILVRSRTILCMFKYAHFN